MTITSCRECQQQFAGHTITEICPDCTTQMRRLRKRCGARWPFEWRLRKRWQLQAEAGDLLKPFSDSARRRCLERWKEARGVTRLCYGTSNLASWRHTSEADIFSQMLFAKAFNALRFRVPCSWTSLSEIMAVEVPLQRFEDHIRQEMAELRRLGLVDFQPQEKLVTLHSTDVNNYVLPMGLRGPSDADRGLALEVIYNRYLPSVQWVFPYRDAWIMSMPDGIAEEYVYEVKTCQEHTYVNTVEHIRNQAHLYAYFWKRPKVFYEIIVGTKTRKATDWTFQVTRIEAKVEDADPELAQWVLQQIPNSVPQRLRQGNLFAGL
jgi:hypothetical protein